MNNNFSYHFPSGDYNNLLKVMSQTSVHSGKTSSIPLVQFWMPESSVQHTHTIELQNKLLECIGIADFSTADKIFEYPTAAYQNGFNGPIIQHSGPSMTDLMIVGKSQRITIEAKYTEYQKDAQPYHPSIGKWIEKHSKNKHLCEILNCWRRYIGLQEYARLEDTQRDKDFPYQFLHRAASACFGSDDKERFLLYQLFYDSDTKDTLGQFENNLSQWSKILELDRRGVQFIIAEIEIDEANSLAIHSKNGSNVFLDMIKTNQYSFGKMVCKNGYTQKVL